MKTLLAVTCAVLVSTLACALPDGWTLTGQAAEQDGWTVAAAPVKLAAPLAPDTLTRLTLRLGAIDRRITCDAAGASGPPLHFEMAAKDDEYRVNIIGKDVFPIPDSCLEMRLNQPGNEIFKDRYYIRPHPHWYEGDERKDLLAKWAELPPASTHEIALDIETRGNLVRFWVDGRCLGGATLDQPKALTLSLPAGVALGKTTLEPAAAGTYLPLDLRSYRRPLSWSAVELPLGRGNVTAGSIPFRVSQPGDEIDVGVSRWLAEQKGPEEYTDNYYTRSSFDNRPEDMLLAIPKDDYSAAHVLCLVDPDPAKTPILTLRLTRYLKDYYDSGGRGDGLADSVIRLEKTGGKWPAGCREVGTVKVQSPSGPRTLPLLQVAMPLHGGQIQDILEEQGQYIGRGTGYLELELTKELHEVETSNHGAYSTKPLGKPSGVQIFGLTLERAPVQVRLRSRQIGNIFYREEGPGVDLEMQSLQDKDFSGKLSWKITDMSGRSTSGQQAVALPATEALRIPVDLAQPQYGWFRADLTMTDAANRPVWDTTTTFAILPPDTRQAGSESPYGIWWFRRSHVGTDDTAEIAPLLQRLGYRHVNPGKVYPGQEQDLAKHGLSVSMLGNFIMKADNIKLLDDAVAANPTARWNIVFHENGFGERTQFPPEFLGKPAPELTAEQKKKYDEMAAKALDYAKYAREKYPHLKLIFGNGSLAFAVEFMRQGFPREYIDAFGDEDLGQQFPPEASPQAFKSVFWMREYAKLYKYDVPITSTYEWRGRGTNPGNLSELEQARIYSRDLLQALAFSMPHINAGLLHDVGDAYFYSRWGSGGVCHRYPQCNPKVSYVALATLTRELDGAKFQRYLPTGSPSLYATEFKRGDGLVYALWLPRGERKVALDFGRDTSFSLTDMSGNTHKLQARGGHATITVSASPCYLATSTPPKVSPAGATVSDPPPGKPAVVDSLTTAGAWTAATEPEKMLEGVHFDFPRQRGDIAVSVAHDAQKKQALQLDLKPMPDVPWPISRYVVLQAKDAQPIPGRPTSVGMWVRGNSSWGRVFWEFEDASGERFLSVGAPCGGWSVGDWPCQTYLSFDGWNYLYEPLPFKYDSGFYGPPQSEWTHTGGDGIVDYPIKLTRLMVEMRDKVVHLTNPMDVPDKTVALRDLSVGYD